MSSFVSTIRQNRNLFDGQLESKIINNDGTIVSNQSYATSINFMEVDGRVFTCSKANTSTEGFRIALYDADKTFLKRLIVGRDELSATVNEPTAIYIKICVQSTSTNGLQVEFGDKATSYIPYGLEKVSHVLQSVSRSNNLFDKNAVFDGYVKSDGSIEVVAWYKASDYIDVGGLEYITYYNTCGSTGTLRKFCFYDSDKNFISAPGSEDNNKPVTLSVPQNAKYFRMSISPSYLDICQLNAGQQALTYQPYGYIFSKALISNKEVVNNA